MTWTSAEAYEAAVASGLISKRRLEVLTDLYKNGPATARGIFERTKLFPGSITPRLVELETQGVVVRKSEKKDGPLKTWSVVWEFYPGKPMPFVRKKAPEPVQPFVLKAYHDALTRIAATRCDCGGPELSLLLTHLPGCVSESEPVTIAYNTLKAFPLS